MAGVKSLISEKEVRKHTKTQDLWRLCSILSSCLENLQDRLLKYVGNKTAVSTAFHIFFSDKALGESYTSCGRHEHRIADIP